MLNNITSDKNYGKKSREQEITDYQIKMLSDKMDDLREQFKRGIIHSYGDHLAVYDEKTFNDDELLLMAITEETYFINFVQDDNDKEILKVLDVYDIDSLGPKHPVGQELIERIESVRK